MCVAIPKPEDDDEQIRPVLETKAKHPAPSEENETKPTSSRNKRLKTKRGKEDTIDKGEKRDIPTENYLRDVTRIMIAARGPSKTC
mmetsp:Transcript_2859/g.7557  ORF Transcript_2859/g.7557 Transcript_2859/m.7557 type:complete len:86 (+) Transcript_2859:341-598(+)